MCCASFARAFLPLGTYSKCEPGRRNSLWDPHITESGKALQRCCENCGGSCLCFFLSIISNCEDKIAKHGTSSSVKVCCTSLRKKVRTYKCIGGYDMQQCVQKILTSDIEFSDTASFKLSPNASNVSSCLF